MFHFKNGVVQKEEKEEGSVLSFKRFLFVLFERFHVFSCIALVKIWKERERERNRIIVDMALDFPNRIAHLPVALN